jgi:enamine deaminase RidA (YjgF/YER057c/UK114 family)
LLAHSWFFTENKLGVSPVPTIQCLNPDSMAKPAAPYSNIARVKASEFLFIAGQIGIGKDGKAPADFEAHSQGAGFPNIASFTSYLVHSQDIPKFAAYRAREFPRLFPGGAFPPNTLLVVDRLVREDLLVEVEAVAAL